MRIATVFNMALLILTSFLVGFVASLALHWAIRPNTLQENSSRYLSNTDSEKKPETVTQTAQTTDKLLAENNQLNQSVAQLEATLENANIEQALTESHAQALIMELQTYRQERDTLFADLEQRKQKLIDKVSELDEKINTQISLREANDEQKNDYDIAHELHSLLGYPHRLNDLAELNEALLAQPKVNQELIEQRFDIILQSVDDKNINDVSTSLQPIVDALNKSHHNDTRLLTVHCSPSYCEIQTQMQATQPYFDYWQQWLVKLSNNHQTKLLQYQFATKNGDTLTGTAIIKINHFQQY